MQILKVTAHNKITKNLKTKKVKAITEIETDRKTTEEVKK